MEDIVAVEVRLADGGHRYFVTWGRAFDSVDPQRLERLALDHARNFALGAQAESAHVCWFLQDASRETYFYEALAQFTAQLSTRPSDAAGSTAWIVDRAREDVDGSGWYYLGKPRDEGV